MKKNKVIEFAQLIANSTISEKGGLEPFNTRYAIEQTKITTKDIYDKLKKKIQEDETLKDFSFNDESLIVLSIFSFFEQLAIVDKSGKQIRTLLGTPMLFMYLFNNFQIKSTKYDQTCSVDDNIWIYEFISKAIEVFISVEYRLKQANFIDYKNIFMILMGIMHENFIHHLDAIPKIQISSTEEALNAAIEKATKEFYDNIESIKKKLLSVVEMAFNPINSSMSSPTFDEEAFLERMNEELKEHFSSQQKELTKQFETFPALLVEIEEKLLTIFERFPQDTQNAEEGEHNPHMSKSSLDASDFIRLKEDIVKETTATVGSVLEKYFDSFNMMVSGAEKAVARISEETEKLNQETATIRNLFLKVEENEKTQKETLAAVSTVIQLIRQQDEKAAAMLDSYNIKHVE